ncbi:thiol reductase thioredoxin, partial [Bordetella pertussis]
AGQLGELLTKVKEVDMAEVHRDIAQARENGEGEQA